MHNCVNVATMLSLIDVCSGLHTQTVVVHIQYVQNTGASYLPVGWPLIIHMHRGGCHTRQACRLSLTVYILISFDVDYSGKVV